MTRLDIEGVFRFSSALSAVSCAGFDQCCRWWSMNCDIISVGSPQPLTFGLTEYYLRYYSCWVLDGSSFPSIKKYFFVVNVVDMVIDSFHEFPGGNQDHLLVRACVCQVCQSVCNVFRSVFDNYA